MEKDVTMNERIDKNSCRNCESLKQTITVTLYMVFMLSAMLLSWIVWFLIVWKSPFWRIPMLLYLGWIFYDRETPLTGSGRSKVLRGLKIWKLHNEYFPAKLIKTADLPTDKNYIFATFPHGILASGAFSAFGHSHSGFEETFPGLKSWVLVLEQHFYTPFLREYCIRMGGLPASAVCINRMLSLETKGNALVLLVGGAQEAFYTEPGRYVFYVKKRKGFVRLALKAGAAIVPVITFGEPDIYTQVRFRENSIGYKIQALVKRVTRVAPTLFYGRFLIMPFKKPMTTVVGEPIYLEKVDEPSQELVDDVHQKFVDKLKELFENEKRKYLPDPDDVQLTIL